VLRIRYSNGTITHGILLALGDQRVRVALKGSDDVVEYRLVNQHWISEECDVVSMTFVDSEESVEVQEDFADNMVASGFDRPVAPHIM
jgi:hypothetical protein